jgi:Cu-Zn family superoxide dismutase
MRKKLIGLGLLGLLSVFTLSAYADISTSIYTTTEKGQGKLLGTVTFSDTKYGLLMTPDLKDLTPGMHGFHIHENPVCTKEGMDAGGHLDPQKTNSHKGPYSDAGHLGDLPALYVNSQGFANQSELAPRLKVSDIKNHSIIVHEGGDNYADVPKLGGGGKRIGCGVIQ